MRAPASKFASRIESMLSAKSAFGYKRENYEKPLLKFDWFCLEKYPSEEKLTKEIVLEWANGSIYRVNAIRAFGKYLVSTGEDDAFVIPDNFTPKKPVSSPYVFTDAELRRFFAAADHFAPQMNDKFLSVIVPVMFRMIYTCGLRPKEGRELKVSGVNTRTGEVLVENAKHHKDRVVVMSGDMTKFCREYLAKRAIMHMGEDTLFPDPYGNVYGNAQINAVFQQCWRNANADICESTLPKVRVYDLRHRFASAVLCKWIGEGKDLTAMLPYLRTYMGHLCISSTAYYVHILPENIMASKGMDWESFAALLPEVGECPE